MGEPVRMVPLVPRAQHRGGPLISRALWVTIHVSCYKEATSTEFGAFSSHKLARTIEQQLSHFVKLVASVAPAYTYRLNGQPWHACALQDIKQYFGVL